MLFSSLSRGSLETDSRDSYGFAVRPHHQETYKKYSRIYKEEEEQRLDKWRDFLEHFGGSVQLCSPANVPKRTSEGKDKSEPIIGTSQSRNHESGMFGVEASRSKSHNLQTWIPIRPPVSLIEKMMRGTKFMAGDNSKVQIPHLPWKQELEFLVRGGVPKHLRGEMWQVFIAVQTRRVERYYQKLVSSEMDPSHKKFPDGCIHRLTITGRAVPDKTKKQIEKDLSRTFPGHPALDEEGRNSLRRILTAYARHNPKVGYCQAMNFIAGLFLLFMPEENAFWALVGIIEDYFDGYYTYDMVESQVDQLVFEELMRERFPKLVNHLDYLGVQLTWIASPWFISIYVNMLPWETVLRMWDVLLFDGNRVMLFRSALAIMELYGPVIISTKDISDALTLLQTFASSTFDSSLLVVTACMSFLAVTEDRLQDLRNKHRPSVLGIIEERTKGIQVSKESKSIATKLSSFKHGPQGVMKMARASSVRASRRKSSRTMSSVTNFDEFLSNINNESESMQDVQEQVSLLELEISFLLEEKRLATVRAEELETAFTEMVKQDNRKQLSSRVEQLEHEVSELQMILARKEQQETKMLEVLMRSEQKQRVTEEARLAAERQIASQTEAAHLLQDKYEKTMELLAQMEKKVVMAESILDATLQYQSGQAKALSSPGKGRQESTSGGLYFKKPSIINFGLGWGDMNKYGSNLDDDRDRQATQMRLMKGSEHEHQYSLRQPSSRFKEARELNSAFFKV